MSVVRARRMWDLWPLALFLVAAVSGAVWLWQAWPQVMRQSILWQR
ncbi:MAG: nickel transporter, partial [Leclercia adecarboxylata]|nr:nickel transporter [Leclercia adecarboxylata]